MKLSQKTAGLSLGSLFGLMHLGWVLAVAAGAGQQLADWWSAKHFVAGDYTVGAFSLGIAILGVILAFVFGYITGWVFAWLWNRFEK
ncbi:MAG: hypothetical protein HYS45_00900 [Parcubacteria group bacterium]|nr:hypothetical protein [Parcubacteria group bacterium]